MIDIDNFNNYNQENYNRIENDRKNYNHKHFIIETLAIIIAIP